MALVDNEELKPEMLASIQRSGEALDRGEIISHEEVLREFGL